MAKDEKRQPTAEIYQEITVKSGKIKYIRTFTPFHNSNYQTLKKNTTENKNYERYKKAIDNKNYGKN